MSRDRRAVLPALGRAVAAICMLASPLLALPATTDISSVPLPTYAVGSGVDVKPNILMVLDDSGSMDWNYLPDWANDRPGNYSALPDYLFRNAAFNGVAYNPAVVYKAPIRFNADGTKDTTTYPSMTGASTTTGADSATKPNWNSVKRDGFGVQSTSSSNLTGNASFYTVVPGVHCDSPAMTNCTTSAVPTGNFAYAAPLRWCSDAALTTCRALQGGTFVYPMMPAPRVSVITVNNATSANVSGITVDSLQIMSGSTGSSSTPSTVATAIANKINDCSATISGNCTTVGYVAYSSGSTVTVLAPGSTSSSPVLTNSGTLGKTITAFSRVVVPLSPFANGTVSSAVVPGENLRTVITPTVLNYPYPGLATKATTRTDCVGVTTCTFQEEMTNYANWFSYYSTRMQMMKSSTSQAFAVLDNDADTLAGVTRYRVGFISINNNTGSDFVNINDFLPAQKVTWYSKLMAAQPNNSTPLRQALSTAGRLYGGKLNGTTLNGTTVTDPMQFSCGKNFTILSTDGFWNGNAGVKLDGTTGVGNADGAFPRPYSDGASTQSQERTSLLQQRTDVLVGDKGTLQKQVSLSEKRTSQLQKLESQLQQQTSQLQKLESQLQQQTSQLQKLESQLQQQTSTLQAITSQLQQQNSILETRTSQLQIQTTREFRTSSNSGGSFGAYQPWTDPSANCTNINSGVNQRQCRNQTSGFSNTASCTNTTWLNCQYTAFTGWSTSAGACTVQAPSGGPTNYTVGVARECRYTTGTFANAASCTVVAPSTGPNYTVTTAVACQYLDSALTPVGSCTVVPKSPGPIYTTALGRQCSYTTPTAFANVGSCTDLPQSTAPSYTVGTASTCRYVDGTFVSTPSCAVVPKSTGPVYTAGVARQCQYTPFTTYANAASCTAAAQSTAPNYTVGVATNCQYVDGAFVNTPSCAVVAKSTGPAYTAGIARQCQYTPYTAYTNVASCTAAAASTSPNFTVGTPTNCQYVDQALTAVASCAAVAKSTGPSFTAGLARQCTYTAWTAYVPSPGTCPALAQSTGPSFTVGVATDCRTTVTAPYANAASCSVAVPDAAGVSTQCQYTFAASAATQVCTPLVVANNYSNATVYRNCATNLGTFANAASCTATTTPNASGQTTACTYGAWTAWSNVGSCTAAPQSTSPNFTVAQARECQVLVTGGTSSTLADVAAYYYTTDLRSSTATGVDATGTCVGPVVPPATTASDLCVDNVPSYGRDNNTKQHMTTHTLGLGAQGMMVYSPYQNNTSGQRVYVPDYWAQPSGDFYAVANGSTSNSATGVCSWLTSGSTCNWPIPSADSIANIDDLWHAAVNGRGTYFSATDPASLATALQTVLGQIVNTPRPGTAAAAASSNPNITSSDNYVFSSSYKSIDWYGELIMQRFNSDGTLTPQQWSAMQLLDCATSPWRANFAYSAGATYSQGGACYVVNADYTTSATFASGSGLDGQNVTVLTGTPYTRTIYTAGTSGSTPVLVPFTWAGLSATQKLYFSTPYINYVSPTQGLTQFCTAGGSCMGAAAQVSASGSALVDFLRGDRTNDGSYYRTRQRVLGDIVSSEARYVKQPLQNYADAGYAGFKTDKAGRTPTVYVGSNDGMLHAFEALTGKESWAFVPSAVLPEMYRLADNNYATKHQYFVDGTPEVGDICPSAPSTACTNLTWKTILVGGMNAGGKSFYAMDVTDPAVPVLLWEFSDANLGYSYSNPRITKLRDGTWVVLVASGYNNADGVGRLFVIKASDGTLIRTISTGAGTPTSPSGLAKLAARASLMPTNNTVDGVYGGDVLGNLWRFDVNNDVGATGYDAQLLVTLKDASGIAQPITAKPTVGVVGNSPLIMVGTGRYLGLNDLSDTQSSSMYAIKDKLDAVTLPTPRSAGSNFVHQTMTDTTCPAGTSTTICDSGQVVRTSIPNPVDWGIRNGWYLDFLIGGERSATDATLALGTLAFTTVKPQSSVTGTVTACTTQDVAVSAKSYLYYLDYLTGGPVDGTGNVVGEELCTCVATRPSVVKTERGDVEGIIRTSGGGATTGTDLGVTNRQNLPVKAGTAPTRRISWRELNGD